MKFRAEQVLQRNGKDDDLESLMGMIQTMIGEARRIQLALHPSLLDDISILATMNWFCREFQKTYAHIRIEIRINIQEEG